MASQLPTYHGSAEDEGQFQLREAYVGEPSPVPPAVEIAPRRPDGANMQLNSDAAELDFQQTAETEHRSFLNRLFGIFTGADKRGDMEADLNRAIERYPEAASNFVLRGELLLKHGQAETAKADFLRAYEIATENVVDQQFGFVAQMTQDRALDGLKRANAALDEAD